MMKHIWIWSFLIINGVAIAAGNSQFRPTADFDNRPLRDPFTTSDKMYAEAGMQPSQRSNAYGGFIPGYGIGGQKAPIMRLKGYVTKKKGKASALLEVEGAGVYVVSKGDEIGLHAIGLNTVLKVLEVGRNGVKVQSGRINQVILVK